jgi:DNA invertase Pin-like site-specific DNA recombinase
MSRPGRDQLVRALNAGLVHTVVIWRLDRLGRTSPELSALFRDFNQRRINLVSLREHIDLSTPSGRLVADIIASVAEYENEVRAERIVAGQAAARAAGKTWGGGVKGKRIKVTLEQKQVIRRMKAEGRKVAAIARAVSLARGTVYSVLTEPHADGRGRPGWPPPAPRTAAARFAARGPCAAPS